MLSSVLRQWRALLLQRDRWALATAALLAVAALVVAATFRDYGSTWDERFQAELGRDVVAWFASGGSESRALSGGSKENLHLYGPVFEVAAELAGSALPLEPLETRHLLNALVALVGVVGAARLARRLGGHRAAFLAAALLVTSPSWWGHGFANSKDIPFAAAYPWLLLALLRASDELPRPGLRRIAAAGAALGAALAVRPGALILLLPLVAGLFAVRLLPPLLRVPARERPGVAAAAAARVAAIVGLGWLGMLAFWPWGLLHPISGPAAAVAAARSFGWEGLVRFAGAWHASADLPRGYVPTLLLSTLPESWLASAVAGGIAAAVAWRRDLVRPSLEAAWLDPALVAAAGVGPILAAVALRPVLYDGVRHFLFVLPALAPLAGWGLSAAVARLPWRAAGAALAVAAALAALALADALRLHPYQYVYFNRAVAGGLAAASREHELDYWGATGREAMEWVARNVTTPPGVRLTVGTTADPSTARRWIERDPAARERFVFISEGVPDLRLATTRWFDHRSVGSVIHVVERMGVPLLYVLDTAIPDGRLVLEAGDLAVVLSAPPGWSGGPDLRLDDPQARYALYRAGARAKVTIVTPRTGPVPTVAELRGVVVRLAVRTLDVDPEMAVPGTVVGPSARGWILAGREASATGDAVSVVIAAVRVGDAAAILIERDSGDPEAASLALREMVRGARLAEPSERRTP